MDGKAHELAFSFADFLTIQLKFELHVDGNPTYYKLLSLPPKKHFTNLTELLRWFHLRNCLCLKEVKISNTVQKKQGLVIHKNEQTCFPASLIIL